MATATHSAVRRVQDATGVDRGRATQLLDEISITDVAFRVRAATVLAIAIQLMVELEPDAELELVHDGGLSSPSVTFALPPGAAGPQLDVDLAGTDAEITDVDVGLLVHDQGDWITNRAVLADGEPVVVGRAWADDGAWDALVVALRAAIAHGVTARWDLTGGAADLLGPDIA